MLCQGILTVATMSFSGDFEWFSKELPIRERRLNEEFSEGAWVIRTSVTEAGFTHEETLVWRGGARAVLATRTLKGQDHSEQMILASNGKYSMTLSRHPQAAKPYRVHTLRANDKQLKFGDVAHTSPIKIGFYISDLLANSGKRDRHGAFRDFTIIDVRRTRDAGVPRIVAHFSDKAHLVNSTYNRRVELTFREDLGWAIENYRLVLLSNGNEEVERVIEMVYDTSRGNRSDLAWIEMKARYFDGGKGGEPVLTKIEARDPDARVSEGEALLSHYGLEELEFMPTQSRRGWAWLAAAVVLLALAILYRRRRMIRDETE